MNGLATSNDSVTVGVIPDSELPTSSDSDIPLVLPETQDKPDLSQKAESSTQENPTVAQGLLGNSSENQSDRQHQKSARNWTATETRTESITEDWGQLEHRFNFLSVYKHNRIHRFYPKIVPEITSQHNRNIGTNVDYIFFTGKID